MGKRPAAKLHTLFVLAKGQYMIHRRLMGEPRRLAARVAVRNARTILHNFERDEGVLVKPNTE